MYGREKMAKIQRALKSCLISEIDGYNFYTWASGRTEDPECKRFLMELAVEEMEHAKALEEAYTRFGGINKGGLSGQEDLIKERTYSVHPCNRWMVDEKTTYREALRIAMDIEHDAVQFYSDLARETEDREIHAFFMGLAETENGHLEILRSQYEACLQPES